jgi:hypothetical protein
MLNQTAPAIFAAFVNNKGIDYINTGDLRK